MILQLGGREYGKRVEMIETTRFD